MKLTELITARISKELHRRIKDEVITRKRTGQRVNEADIVREALIEHAQRRTERKEPLAA